MTPPRTLMGSLSQRSRGHRMIRRGVLALALVVAIVLALFPQKYQASVTLTPSDPSTLGLSGALGQLGALNNVFGNQAAIEVALKVARSQDVRQEVIRKLDLVKVLGVGDEIAAHRWLEAHVDIRSLRGGIILMETKLTDAALGVRLVTAFADGSRQRLGAIGRNQTAYKRRVLDDLVADAGRRMDAAQRAYDAFRLRTRYSQPQASIEAIGERVPRLQAEIKSKEVQLAATRQFATEDNMTVRQLVAELGALRRQLAEAEATNPTQDDSVGRVVRQSTQAEVLERELSTAKSLYYNYLRFRDGTAVEDLTSTANIRILEPPHVDTERQINLVPAAAALLILLLALAIEFYEARPPVGMREPLHA